MWKFVWSNSHLSDQGIRKMQVMICIGTRILRSISMVNDLLAIES